MRDASLDEVMGMLRRSPRRAGFELGFERSCSQEQCDISGADSGTDPRHRPRHVRDMSWTCPTAGTELDPDGAGGGGSGEGESVVAPPRAGAGVPTASERVGTS